MRREPNSDERKPAKVQSKTRYPGKQKLVCTQAKRKQWRKHVLILEIEGLAIDKNDYIWCQGSVLGWWNELALENVTCESSSNGCMDGWSCRKGIV